MAFLVSEFLTLVRQVGMLSDHATPGTDDVDILLMADRELQTRMANLIVSSGQEWWVCTQKIPLVAARSRYKVPRRAVLGKIRDLVYELSDGTRRNLNQITLAEAKELGTAATGEPSAFYVKGEAIHVWPEPTSSSGYLVADFYARPGKLTDASLAESAITGITVTGNTFEIAYGASETLIGTGAGLRVDILRADSGGGCMAVDLDGDVNTAGTFEGAYSYQLPEDYGICVGDYVVPSESCYAIPLPTELQGVFVQATVTSIARALGLSNYDRQQAMLEQLLGEARQNMAPRAESGDLVVRGGVLDSMNTRGSFGGLW